ncbi:hypothetical protein [Sporolactobacillus putidus]|uniref:Uncharacterized protein n=1 Tax=Sporolactobacillus putidus TaxID=492735 RepID=A0A917W2W9_9BACL|nr:hypothetical protein [Sporolactobacillus putidus]GGL55694.1 hypothetical protein GCM10007968_19760 [Sporolactobacillus putidus]
MLKQIIGLAEKIMISLVVKIGADYLEKNNLKFIKLIPKWFFVLLGYIAIAYMIFSIISFLYKFVINKMRSYFDSLQEDNLFVGSINDNRFYEYLLYFNYSGIFWELYYNFNSMEIGDITALCPNCGIELTETLTYLHKYQFNCEKGHSFKTSNYSLFTLKQKMLRILVNKLKTDDTKDIRIKKNPTFLKFY